MSALIIIRGWPGSGKSTRAREIFCEHAMAGGICYHYEADKFFTNGDGKYCWTRELIKEAHEWCRLNVLRALTLTPKADVIVSNTFTTMWEMEPYFKLAKQYDRDIIVYDMKGEYDNVHGVPPAKVEEMKARFYQIRFDAFPEYFGKRHHFVVDKPGFTANYFQHAIP